MLNFEIVYGKTPTEMIGRISEKINKVFHVEM